NTLGVIPTVTFGFNATGTTSPDFTYDSRLGSTAYDYLMNVRDNLTLNRGKHTWKFGGLFEFMENNEARGGTWMGQFQFNNTNNNPANHTLALLNSAAGGPPTSPREEPLRRHAQPAALVGMVRAGHVAGDAAVHPRLRRALPRLHAVLASRSADRELRSRE